MSAALNQIVVSGVSAASELLSFSPSVIVGGIGVDTTIEEEHTDRLEITEHPVEAGAEITDHSYLVTPRLRLSCGWSNSGPQAAEGAITGIIAGGGLAAADYVSGIYSALLALQQSRQPLTVSTGIRLYSNMLIEELTLHRDKLTSNALMVEMALRQISIVSTTVALLPSQANQANPASTSATQSVGTTSLQPGNPTNGGSLAPSSWGPL